MDEQRLGWQKKEERYDARSSLLALALALALVPWPGGGEERKLMPGRERGKRT